MKKDEEGASTGVDYFHRLARAGGGGIPLPPKPKNPNPTPPSGGGSGGSGGGGSSSGGGGGRGSGGSSGGGGVNTYADYLAAQKREQRKAQNKAARRYVADAEALRGQARALEQLLGRGQKGPDRKGGTERNLRGELKTKLGNVRRAFHTQDKLLSELYGERVGALQQSAEDNEVAADSQSIAALSNRQRERANAVSEVLAQGGGESDLLRAQQMSLRNYEANQKEVNRNYADSLSSINASLTDLTADTKTGRLSAFSQYNSDRELLYTNFYDAKAEAETQLGNTYGQMAEYYGLANEQVSKKKFRRKQKHLTKLSNQAFGSSAHTAAQAFKAPKPDKALVDWQGAADFEGKLNNGAFTGAGTELSRPEGATLRRFEQ